VTGVVNTPFQLPDATTISVDPETEKDPPLLVTTIGNQFRSTSVPDETVDPEEILTDPIPICAPVRVMIGFVMIG
jgi:hypothetical protein